MLVPTLAQKPSFSPHFYLELVSFFHCIALKKPLSNYWYLKNPKPSVKVGALRSWWPLVGRWGETVEGAGVDNSLAWAGAFDFGLTEPDGFD